jgi:hypothetical protein
MIPLLAVVIGGLAVLYAFAVRPRMNRWGATEEELAKTLPGDTVDPSMSPFQAELATGRRVSTRAITIEAPPDEVWPWLVQMGHDRAGFYSHDWVERLLGIRYADGQSSTRIHPEFQDLRVGDTVPYHPFNHVPVLALDRPRYFQAGERLILEPLDDGTRTRLIARTTAGWVEPFARRVPVFGPVILPIAAAIDRGPGELLHHYMEAGMLEGLKVRAEASHGAGRAAPVADAID